MDAASILLVLAAIGMGDGAPATQTSAEGQATSVLQMGPIPHTAYFAGQSGWSSDTSATPSNYDRYNAPAVVDRTRSAVVETGNALREGVEAGIQQANQQLYQGSQQVINSAQTAGQDVSRQFQGWAGTSTPQNSTRGQVSNPFATSPSSSQATNSSTSSRNGVSSPWANAAPSQPSWPAQSGVQPPPRTASMEPIVVTQTPGGWTTVNSSQAPPRLQVPQLFNTPPVEPVVIDSPEITALQPMVTSSGPGFPQNSQSEQSLLAQSPPRQEMSNATNDDFSIGWENNASRQPVQSATIVGRYDNTRQETSSDVSPPPATMRAPGQQSSLDADFDRWSTDLSTNPASVTQPNAGSAPNPNVGTAPMQAFAANGGQPAAGNAMQTPINSQTAAPQPANAPNGPQQPWMPLVFATAALAGSIGANLFLGWSYMDARQRYRHLVQKTASKFRRAASAA